MLTESPFCGLHTPSISNSSPFDCLNELAFPPEDGGTRIVLTDIPLPALRLGDPAEARTVPSVRLRSARSDSSEPHDAAVRRSPRHSSSPAPQSPRRSGVEIQRAQKAARLFGKLRSLAEARWDERDACDLAGLLSALAENQTTDDRLLERLKQRVQRETALFTPQSLVKIAEAYAKLNLPDTAFYSALAERLIPRFTALAPGEAVTAVWSFAIGLSACRQAAPAVGQEALRADPRAAAVFDRVWQEFTSRPEMLQRLSRPGLIKAYQAGLSWGKEFFSPLGDRSERAARYKELFTALRERTEYMEMTCSEGEKQLGRTLRRLLPHPEELQCDGATWAWGFNPDFLFALGDTFWVVEFDGDIWHTIQGAEDRRLRGKDVLGEMIFRRMGLNVLHVLASEWPGTAEEQRRFVAERLGN